MSNSFKSETAPFLFEKILAAIERMQVKEQKQEALAGVIESIGRACLGDYAIPLFKKALEIIKEIKGGLSSALFSSFASALKESGLGEKGLELENELMKLSKRIKRKDEIWTTALDMALTLHFPESDQVEPNWEKARKVLRRLKGKRKLEYDMFFPILYEMFIGKKKGYIDEVKEMAREVIDFALGLPNIVLSEPDKMALLSSVFEELEDVKAREEMVNFVLDIASQKWSLLSFISMFRFVSLITSLRLPPDSPVYIRLLDLAKKMKGGLLKNTILRLILENYLESEAGWVAVREAMLAFEEEMKIPDTLFYLGRIRQMAERGDFTSGIEEAALQGEGLRAKVLKIIASVVSRRAREG